MCGGCRSLASAVSTILLFFPRPIPDSIRRSQHFMDAGSRAQHPKRVRTNFKCSVKDDRRGLFFYSRVCFWCAVNGKKESEQ